MKFVRPISLLLVVFTLLLGMVGVSARAQSPDPKNDPIFQKAKQLEVDQPLKALDEYQNLKKDYDNRNRDIAAEALLRASLLGYNTLLQPASTEGSAAARTQRAEAQLNVAVKAHEAVKMLYQSPYLDTPSGKAAEALKYGKAGNQDLRDALEMQLDERNSRNFNYKLVDSMVKLTGSRPAFSYWFALILIAVIVRMLTLPLTLRMYKSQREIQRIQPQLKQLQEKYKDDKVVLNEKLMAFYKEHNVNPAASCLPMLIQLPFMWWVYSTIRLYEFHFSHGTFLWIGSGLAHTFPGIVAANLGQFDIPLLCIYAASNYLTMQLTPATDPTQAQTQKTTAVMMTIMMFWMFMTYRWSAAFIFYWLVLNLFSAWQQYTYIYKPNRLNKLNNSDNGGGAAVLLPAEGAQNNGGNGARGPVIESPVTAIPNASMRARPRRKRK